MKNFLPKTLRNPQGFTLVELLVVISIIAILVVVGFSVFSGAQAQARDGRRRTEIDSLGKSIETGKNPDPNAATIYTYNDVRLAQDFPTNQPVDPQDAATPRRSYCIATNPVLAPVPVAVAGALQANGCPANPAGFTYVPATGAGGLFAVGGGGLPAVTRAWTLCVLLERQAPAPFCFQSLTR